jgi:hypothetical protein
MDILKPIREQSLQTPGRAHKSLAFHRELLIAIERHDPALARRAMQRHIEAVEQNVLAPTSNRRRSSEASGQREKRPSRDLSTETSRKARTSTKPSSLDASMPI